MKQLAKILGMELTSGSLFYKIFHRVGNLLGKHTVSGNLRGKQIEIYTTKLPNLKQLPVRLVVRTKISSDYEIEIFVKTKPYFSSLHKIFEKNLCASGSPILDRRILFSTKNKEILRKILKYEELQDKFCDVWTSGRSNGTLIISSNSIIYHEPFRLITRQTRERIKNAANLICDIADVLKLLNVATNQRPSRQ